MSFQADCEQLISENVNKLIKSLTSFKESDENFGICRNFMLSKIKYGTFPSTNSHEVKRRIDGFCERLEIAGLGDHTPKVRELFNKFINYKECVEHVQTDIHWSIISLLFDLAYSPVNNLKDHPELLDNIFEVMDKFNDTGDDDVFQLNQSLIALKANLARENIKSDDYSDSELSDWSETTEEDNDEQPKVNGFTESSKPLNKSNILRIEDLRISPPKKISSLTTFDGENSEEWLRENVQPPWWSDKDFTAPIYSDFEQSDFCLRWNHFTMDLVKDEQISTISEHCLIRETLFMFYKPTSCKIFKNVNGKIELNENVSIPSVSVQGLNQFLETFTAHMSYSHELMKFCEKILNTAEFRLNVPPTTYEVYANVVLDLMVPIKHFAVEKEKIIKDQEVFCSIITLLNDFQPHFNTLETLYRLHKFAIIDFDTYPAHICSANLLAKIFRSLQNCSNPEQSNLVTVVYLKTIRSFLSITDVWWMKGTLDDPRCEFFIEKLYVEGHKQIQYVERPFTPSEKFHLDDAIAKTIAVDEMLNIMRKSLIRSASSLKILHQLNRVGEWKVENKSKNLYDNFVIEVNRKLLKMTGVEWMIDDELNNNVGGTATEVTPKTKPAGNKNEFDRKEFEQTPPDSCDEFMLMAFKSSLDIAEAQIKHRIESHDNVRSMESNDSVEMLKRLNAASKMSLPSGIIIPNICASLLEARFQVVNNFLTVIYKEDLKILTHLQNLRKVLFLEASDLMHYFYTNLFEQIENSELWANSYHLTVQLNAILCARYSNLVCHVEIIGPQAIDTAEVIDAIKFINIKLDFPTMCSIVIDGDNMLMYNTIFQFLVKVKWCIWTLENLRFPDRYKKRPPYAKLTINDLVMRRLAVVRLWMLYSMQNLHNYLIEQVILPLSHQMDSRVESSTSLDEIISIHREFINMVYDYCFQAKDQASLKVGITQLFILVRAIKNEWILSCQSKFNEFSNKNVDKLEESYIKCYQMIAETLTSEVYSKGKAHLEALCSAFNCSIPY